LTIKTKINNQSWDIKSSGRTDNMQIWSTNSQWFQIFQYDGTYFTNIQDKRVLDVKDANDEKEAQPVIVAKR
jgi:hypothetical protein